MHTFARELMQTTILIYINRFRHSTCTRKEIASFNNFHPFFLYGLCVFNDFYHGYKDLFWSIDLFSFGPDKLLRMNVQGEPDIIILQNIDFDETFFFYFYLFRHVSQVNRSQLVIYHEVIISSNNNFMVISLSVHVNKLQGKTIIS